MATTTLVSFGFLFIPSEFIIYCVYYKNKFFSRMQFDLEPGDYVINPLNKDWGIGQIQSIAKNKITVNFENYGKQVLNSDNIKLEKFNNGSNRS
tara:strand:- start:305 stop:586 length:282 start_codon:yes stop_codon:yes gene_type:complete